MLNTKSSIAVYDKINALIEDLYYCTKEKQIDDVFAKGNITDATEKIQLLRKCMGVTSTFGTIEKISVDEEYEFEKAVFMEGTWRMLN